MLLIEKIKILLLSLLLFLFCSCNIAKKSEEKINEIPTKESAFIKLKEIQMNAVEYNKEYSEFLIKYGLDGVSSPSKEQVTLFIDKLAPNHWGINTAPKVELVCKNEIKKLIENPKLLTKEDKQELLNLLDWFTIHDGLLEHNVEFLSRENGDVLGFLNEEVLNFLKAEDRGLVGFFENKMSNKAKECLNILKPALTEIQSTKEKLLSLEI